MGRRQIPKTCDNCGATFYLSTKDSKKVRESQKTCSPACCNAILSKIARARPERSCIYCKRILPVESFNQRPSGLALPYCRECDIVKGRLRYDRNSRGVRKFKPGKSRDPVKAKARAALNSAVRSGRVMPQPCQVCGAKAQGHHADYSKPLDVTWLCPVHHGQVHWRPVDTPIALEALTIIRSRAAVTPVTMEGGGDVE